MSLILESTEEKTMLQKGDAVFVQLFNGSYFTIACCRNGEIILQPSGDDKWLVLGGESAMEDIMLILGDIYGVSLHEKRRTKESILFSVV